MLRLLRAHLRDGTLRGSLLDLFDDSIPALGGLGKLVLDLALLVVELLLLLKLNVFNPLLVLLVVSLGLLELGAVLEGGSASHLVLELGFLGVELFLGFLSLGLRVLHNLLVVELCPLLDVVELVDSALLSIGVPLLQFTLSLLRFGLLLGRLALSHELDLVVVSFRSFLDIGHLHSPVGFGGLELLAQALDCFLTLSALHGRLALLGLLNLDGELLDLRKLTSDHLRLSLSGLLEFVLNLLQGDWVLLSLLEALLDRWVGSEVLVEWEVEADWLGCCLWRLHDVLVFWLLVFL